VYQDLFGECIFTGKGLYDVDTFTAVLDGRVPENAVLSHDLFEGLFARAGLVTDVEVIDDYPASVLAHARRQHRWVRGDWQILRWLFPLVPTRAGFTRNRLPLGARWKILDNLRRSLTAPATLAALLAVWTFAPAPPLPWTLAALAAPLAPLVLRVLSGLTRTLRLRMDTVALAAFVGDLRIDIARALLDVTLVAQTTWAMLHAIGVTLTRMWVTRRRLLEWETAATSAARASGARCGASPRR
jgi:cyclic beta-1,2-glucan synthetase